MKQYGANKSTEFSRKQIGVIYCLAKKGDLKVERFIMSDMYDVADYYGYDDNGSVENSESKILLILSDVFENKLEDAQEKINAYTISTFDSYGKKYQKSANRELVK